MFTRRFIPSISLLWVLVLFIILLQSCSPKSTPAPQSEAVPIYLTSTPLTLPTPTDQPKNTIWIDPNLPGFIRTQAMVPDGYEAIDDPEQAVYRLGFTSDTGRSHSVYLLCAPFFTIRDHVSLSEVKAVWKSATSTTVIHLDEETLQIFTQKWGKPGTSISLIEKYDQIEVQPDDPNAWILLPFQELRPEWKLLFVDGKNPLDHYFAPVEYPLTVFFDIDSKAAVPVELNNWLDAIQPNYDPDKLSIVVMTGTTALTRGTAHQMDINGVKWPGKDIRSILREADITHISNEVSFYEHCSKGNPNERSLMFCSRPEYLDLLIDVGTDVVELSGNHNLDYGKKPYRDSLTLYQQNEILTYAGGLNEEAARQPALFEDHGNKFAFLGCNFVGPRFAMATDTSMGAAHCDFEYFSNQITSLRQQGYLPIFTFQYSEYTIHKPGEHQERDYRRMVDAGAVVVSGSQAHYPQVMALYQDSFIHYGLGNLFFDQMDKPVKGTREEFIDRHYFYNGRYIGTELITALLEDAARPRPMTTAERIDFLSRIYADALGK